MNSKLGESKLGDELKYRLVRFNIFSRIMKPISPSKNRISYKVKREVRGRLSTALFVKILLCVKEPLKSSIFNWIERNKHGEW